MTQYIDKDDLVAEIERIEYETNYEPFTDEVLGKRFVCKSLLSFIDTLEVKEVDLEKEMVVYHNENFSQCNDGTLLSCETGTELTWYDYEYIARHFFELGMHQSNNSNSNGGNNNEQTSREN